MASSHLNSFGVGYMYALSTLQPADISKLERWSEDASVTVNRKDIADNTWIGVHEIHPAKIVDKKVRKAMEIDLVELVLRMEVRSETQVRQQVAKLFKYVVPQIDEPFEKRDLGPLYSKKLVCARIPEYTRLYLSFKCIILPLYPQSHPGNLKLLLFVGLHSGGE